MISFVMALFLPLDSLTAYLSISQSSLKTHLPSASFDLSELFELLKADWIQMNRCCRRICDWKITRNGNWHRRTSGWPLVCTYLTISKCYPRHPAFRPIVTIIGHIWSFQLLIAIRYSKLWSLSVDPLSLYLSLSEMFPVLGAAY